jgi:hypothetical protein
VVRTAKLVLHQAEHRMASRWEARLEGDHAVAEALRSSVEFGKATPNRVEQARLAEVRPTLWGLVRWVVHLVAQVEPER